MLAKKNRKVNSQKKQEPNLLELLSGVKEIYEDIDGDNIQGVDDYQTEGLMPLATIENILSRLTDKGLSHKFQGNQLILAISCYSGDSNLSFATNDLKRDLDSAVEFLKREYKAKAGKALTLKEVGQADIDVVAAYTVQRKSLVRYTRVFELPEDVTKSTTKAEKTPPQSVTYK